jgi:hypothetical protein
MNYKKAYEKQKELIYQLSKQPNAIGREWRERVERLESELSALEAEKEEESQPEITEEILKDFQKWHNSETCIEIDDITIIEYLNQLKTK